MHKIFSCLLFISLIWVSQACNQTANERVREGVVFSVVSPAPFSGPEQLLYLAGGFNGWNPADTAFRLNYRAEGVFEIYLETFSKEMEYKYTRGSWSTVEKSAAGTDIPNRKITAEAGQVVNDTIARWAAAGVAQPSTASPQVSVLSEAFEMTSLQRSRRVWLYLPPDYAQTTKSYPVVYMHDGQNVFDEATSFAGEWAVDETLDKMHEEGLEVPIVVAIDNGQEYRMQEYLPFEHPNYGKAEGDAYLDFLAKELKPYIDSHYRTMPDAAHTCLGGSSMGGLITFWGGWRHPDVFGRLMVFSPSFWAAPKVIDALSTAPYPLTSRLYLLAGGREGADMVPDAQRVVNLIKQGGYPENQLRLVVRPDGRHQEAFWRSEFREALVWLQGEQ